MNWKPTVILAVLLVSGLGAWAIFKPKPAVTEELQKPFNYPEAEFSRLEIQAPGQAEVILQRTPTGIAGIQWMITAPIEKPADDQRIMDMLMALKRMSREGGLAVGHPDYDLVRMGLDKPELSISVFTGTRKQAIRFGRILNTDSYARYFQIDGESPAYIGPTQAFDAFNRKLADLRNRSLVHFEPHRVRGFRLETRLEKPKHILDDKGQPKKDEKGVPMLDYVLDDKGQPKLDAKGNKIAKMDSVFEKTTFALNEKPGLPGGLRGWYAVDFDGVAWNERAEQLKIEFMISKILRDFPVDQFLENVPLEEFGLDKPETRYVFTVVGLPNPITIDFGKRTEKDGKKLIYVRLNEGREVVLVPANPYDQMGRDRAAFRTLDVFEFKHEEIEEVLLVSELGRFRLKKYTLAVPQGQEPVPPTWKVEEPAGIPYDAMAAEQYIKEISRLSIDKFLFTQPDLKLFRLDPPQLVATFTIKRKTGALETFEYKFGCPSDGSDAYLVKPGSKEVYSILRAYWKLLDRMDLNVRTMIMFDVTLDSLREVTFDFKGDDIVRDIYYSIKRNDKGEWEYADKENVQKGTKIDKERLKILLSRVNWIKADSYLTRDPKEAKEFGLGTLDSNGKLKIVYVPDPAQPTVMAERVIQISKTFTVPPPSMAKVHFAKLMPRAGEAPTSDLDTIFRMEHDFIEMVKTGVKFEKATDEGNKPLPTPGPPDDPHKGHNHK